MNLQMAVKIFNLIEKDEVVDFVLLS